MGGEDAPAGVPTAHTHGLVGVNCGICDRELNKDENSPAYNCGGDCRECMAGAGDPDCIASLTVIWLDEFYDKVRTEVEFTVKRIAALPHEEPMYVEDDIKTRMQENLRVW